MTATGRSGTAIVALLAVVLAGCAGTPSSDPEPSPGQTTDPVSAPETDAPSPTTSSTRTIEVFFSHERRGDPCEDVFPVHRDVPLAAPLRGALEALLSGPTSAERADGYGGWFSEATADLLDGVRIEQARALVSFRSSLPQVIPNASSSCGSTALLAALDATATQFSEVDEAWYDLEGDRAAFYGWLQLVAPDDEPVAAPSPTNPPTTAPPTSDPVTTPPRPPSWPALDGTEWTTLPPEAGNVVALTFDAGANGDAVPSILATLEAAHAPGTFFLTGQWVIAYPQLSSAISAQHAVGNHSLSHPDLSQLTDDAVIAEVVGAQDAITDGTRNDPRPWFRFPYGASDTRTLDLVGGLGYRSVRWTVDTLGWQGTSGGNSAALVVERVIDSLRPGAIVLMHVGSNPEDGSTLDADALPEVIERTRAAGYTLVDLDDVAAG